ncbi:helix-turn-helix domain-containing protein [Luteimonas sp. 8-5]|uniref:helix-turn-helix domain-containing protein n=1 Tax=Luteimonas sp. 8-5 TaxID=3039387 RepID=UPI0024362CB9|nr:helix-turn-helix domain-containing protein [Luteimonas sp. 8-5]MDG6349110.1 helix-turn-helix domain-containing protein [Luteimonas sp. 8-5]
MSTPIIPSTSFATELLPGDEQFDAWRQAISVVFDVAPLHEARKGFRAKVRAFHLGELLLVNTRFDSQRFVRSQRQARSDWMDHFLVQYYRRGGNAGTVDDREIRTPPGSVSVLDLAHGVETQANAAECLTLVVPRQVMSAILPGCTGLHGYILDPASGGLLGDFMASLERRLPHTHANQAAGIAEATGQLLAACLQPSSNHEARTRVQDDAFLLDRAKRHIEQQLDTTGHDAAAQLQVDAICRAVGASRSRLYALFQPHGGVRQYIQHRRLMRVHRALADRRQRDPIMRLAERHGFSSHAHLSRLFQKHFGYSPSDVRADPTIALLARAAAGVEEQEAGFDDWVRTLG